MTSWRERLLGSRDRLGWWTVPVFVAVGLAGAVLAGSLAVVYYGQQVGGLREETRAGREELRNAVEDVQEAGDEALAAIDDRVESLDESLPVDDALELGVVGIAVTTRAAPQPSPASPTSPEPAAPSPTGSPAALSAPRAQSEAPQRRTGSAVAVAVDGDATFFATTHSLVADPHSPGGVVETVEVATGSGNTTGEVHSWHEERDLALVRAAVSGIEPAEWRPPDDTLPPGARVVAVAVTPTLRTVQIGAAVALAGQEAIVTDLPDHALLRGGVLLDRQGRIVAVVSTGYQPFGEAAGDDQAAIPVRLLCEQLLRACP